MLRFHRTTVLVAVLFLAAGCTPSPDAGSSPPPSVPPPAPPPPPPPPPPPALSCASTVPTGRLTQSGGAGAPFIYTTSAGWTITIAKAQFITAVYAAGNISFESWGSAGGVGNAFLTGAQHENINGTHIKDWLAPHRTILLPGGVKLTMSAFEHPIAPNVYPVTTVSIYDGNETHRIDAQNHQVVYSCAIANFEEPEEYDGEAAQIVAESRGWFFEQRYSQAASTTGTPSRLVPMVYPLARTYTDNPGQVNDYYSGP